MERPRVLACLVVPPHLSVSGGARAAEHLSLALAPHCGIRVASMMNGGAEGDLLRDHRIAVRSWLPPLLPWSLLPNRYSTLFYRSDLPRIAAAEACDIVHLHNPMPALEMERVARTCTARGLPYVITTHGFNEVANGGQIYGFDAARRAIWNRLVVAPVRRVVQGAASIFVLSEADIPIVRGFGFAGPTPVVPNGVAIPPLEDAADQGLLARFGLGGPEPCEGITYMFLANHTPNKGLPVLFEAFARLTRPFTLIVGGETRDTIDYDRAQASCGPGQRIIVTGRLTDREVGALFRHADLFVFPTLADTFPLAVLEAMAHGTPVLASAVGGIPHQLTPETGVLVPPGEPAALAEAVAGLATAPDCLVAMGLAARERAIAEYSWARAAERALDGYRAVLDGGRTPQHGGAAGQRALEPAAG